MQILEVNGLRKVYTTRFGGASVEALKNAIDENVRQTRELFAER